MEKSKTIREEIFEILQKSGDPMSRSKIHQHITASRGLVNRRNVDQVVTDLLNSGFVKKYACPCDVGSLYWLTTEANKRKNIHTCELERIE